MSAPAFTQGSDLVGKDVALSLRFADGRTRNLSGRLCSFNERGGLIIDCWPMTFLASEVISVAALARAEGDAQ